MGHPEKLATYGTQSEKKKKKKKPFYSGNHWSYVQYTVEKTKVAIRNGQFRDDWQHWVHSVQDTRRKHTKQKTHNIYVGHHYMQTNTNNVNKT